MAATAPVELIDDHVSPVQCARAVKALLKHAHAAENKRAESELLPGAEQHVWLVLAVKQMHPEKKLKPFRIPLAHPLVDPRTSGVCLITKDPQREYKDLLAAQGVKFVSRVVGVEKLKGKFKPFEARRMLLRENGLFLADERVVPLLPKLLGKEFFKAKKQPIPVNLTKKDVKGELERAVSATYMHQNQGTCTSIKIGTLAQPAAHVLANLAAALPAVVRRTPGGWDNVQSLHVKTSSSASLPVWTCALADGAGGRWDGLSAPAVAGEDAELDDEEAEEAIAPTLPPMAKGAKKRAAEAGEDAPKKKKKAAAPADPAAVASSPTAAPKAKKGKAAGGVSAPAPAKSTPADIAAPKAVKTTTTVTTVESTPVSAKGGKTKTKTTVVSASKTVSPAGPSVPTVTSTSDARSVVTTKPKRKALASSDSTDPSAELPLTKDMNEAQTSKSRKAKVVAADITDMPAPPRGKRASMAKAAAADAGDSDRASAEAPPPTRAVDTQPPSRADVKAKRDAAAGVGERKKEKVVKTRAGGVKGAKEMLLGRKK